MVSQLEATKGGFRDDERKKHKSKRGGGDDRHRYKATWLDKICTETWGVFLFSFFSKCIMKKDTKLGEGK
jgi:hypothetical protein